jgi:hypothetical protein
MSDENEKYVLEKKFVRNFKTLIKRYTTEEWLVRGAVIAVSTSVLLYFSGYGILYNSTVVNTTYDGNPVRYKRCKYWTGFGSEYNNISNRPSRAGSRFIGPPYTLRELYSVKCPYVASRFFSRRFGGG